MRKNSFVSRAFARNRAPEEQTGPWWLSIIVVLFMVSFTLRVVVNNVAPALDIIAADLQLSKATAGLTSTLPLLCFGVFAFLTSPLMQRFGSSVTILLALGALFAGTALRAIPTFPGLMIGTALVGIGAAIGNVTVPVAIRDYYPHRAPVLTSWYSIGLTVGAAVGAAATIPLIELGLPWNWAVSVWIVLLALVGAWWVVAFRRAQPNPQSSANVNAESPQAVPMRGLLRYWYVWAICALMSLQGGMFFLVMTWLPTWLTEEGFSPATAGSITGVWSLMGLVGALIGPQILRLPGWIAVELVYLVIFLASGITLGYGGFGSAGLAWGAAIVSGICEGVILSQTFAFITGQSNPAIVPGLSAFSNGVGWLLSAGMPSAFGYLASVTGSWDLAIWLTFLIPLVFVAIAIPVNIQIKNSRDQARAERVAAVADPDSP